jgi:hypothetical protein
MLALLVAALVPTVVRSMLSCGYTAVTGVSAGSARPLSSNGKALVIGYMAYFPRQLTRSRPRTSRETSNDRFGVTHPFEGETRAVPEWPTQQLLQQFARACAR